jgi:hypothetical protein
LILCHADVGADFADVAAFGEATDQRPVGDARRVRLRERGVAPFGVGEDQRRDRRRRVRAQRRRRDRRGAFPCLLQFDGLLEVSALEESGAVR